MLSLLQHIYLNAHELISETCYEVYATLLFLVNELNGFLW